MHTSEISSIVNVSQQDLQNPAVYKDKLANACRIGFFYLEIPKDWQHLLEAAKTFGHSFYKDKAIKELKLSGYSGYHDRNTGVRPSQAESIYLERAHWSQPFISKELKELAERMTALSADVLRKSLEACEVPEEYWNVATGGASDNKGTVHLTFNHYRPEIATEGLNVHADYGAITLLFAETAGLHAKRGDEWPEVPVLENHFVVNFGTALAACVPNLTAVPHYVRRVYEERISFGIFNDHHVDKPVYQLLEPTAKQLYDKLFTKTYQ